MGRHLMYLVSHVQLKHLKQHLPLLLLAQIYRSESEEEFVDGEGMPADAAGPMEVHEYRSDSEHSDSDEDLEADLGPSKNKKMKKVNWRKCVDTKLDESAETPLILEEEFPDLPEGIFQRFFAMEIITMIREETLRYPKSKNNDSFDISEKIS